MNSKITRRAALGGLAAAAPALWLRRAGAQSAGARTIAAGPFQANWE